MLRALGLGDLLTAVPALRALRACFPRHELVLAAPERLREAVEEVGGVDRLLPTGTADRAVPKSLQWQGTPPEVAVNLHGSGPQSLEVLRTVGAARLFSFGADGPSWDPDEHERVRWCRLLRWYGVPADPEDFLLPGLHKPGLHKPGLCKPGQIPGPIVLHPGADAAARRWPVERFTELAGRLAASGATVVVSAGRGEGEQAREIANDAGLSAGAVVGGDADIPFRGLTELIGGANALVSGDTGVAHVAVALGTPSVTLYGPVSPALWGPPARSRHIALWHPDPGSGLRPGDPRGAAPDERLLRISVTEVLSALRSVQTGWGRPTPE